jgi:hypothetical protein
MPRLGGERPGQGGITRVGGLLRRGQGIGHRPSVGRRRGVGLICRGLRLYRRRLRGCQTHWLITCAREAARRCESRGAAVLRKRHRRRRFRRFKRRRSGWITVDHRRTGSRRRGLSPAAFGPVVHGPRSVGLARGGRKPPWLSGLGIRLRHRKRIIGRRRCRLLGHEGDRWLAGRRHRHRGLRRRCRFTLTRGATDSQRPDHAKPCTGAEDGPQQHWEARVPWGYHKVLSRRAFGFLGGLCGFLHQRVPGG